MAAELVGGALLSSFLQVAFDKLASPDILDYFRGRKLNETLLKRLKVTLLVIDAVIDDAENKQIRNRKVRAWVDEVKDGAYEAEDLLDEIDTEISKRKQLEAEGQTGNTNKVWKFLNAYVTSFDKEIESRMKQVLDNLEYLASQKDILGLREASGLVVRFGRMLERPPTTSLVNESEIYGRNDDKEKMIGCLLSNNEVGNYPYSVISVVAMGGMGKTTLTQLVYDDDRMESEFDVKAWVCVSEEFDVVRVTRTILEAITLSVDDTKDKNMLQLKLKQKLVGRKFFIVLDDVWNENYLNWEDLSKPFIEGVWGSKILVTSRSFKVAESMRSAKIIHLNELLEGDSWLLFSRHAFHGRNPDLNPGLVEIGRKILKKCKGLPLALKVIGSLLYSKVSYEEWNTILRSEIWDISDKENDITLALRLSYHYLPSNLKRCFAYCSLFPKDYEFDKNNLVRLWMGENFLQSSKSNKSIKEVGDDYFYELLSRSFFQYSKKDKKYYFLKEAEEYFIMHDLVSDLAKYAYGEFCFRLEVKETVPQTISEKTRHFLFISKIGRKEDSKRFESIYKAKKLRTFLHVNMFNDTYCCCRIYPEISDDVLSKFRYLRVLSFCYFNIVELPDSIGKLKHLRYLDLSCTGIIKLPDSVCLLYNLQVLKLRFCRSLVELPSDLHKLVNLQYLDIECTQVRKMPMGLGKLKHLQVLTSFFVGKSDIQQLAELHLGGELSILGLQNIENPMDALAVNLKNKIYLDKLMLGWDNDTKESEKERNVLEKLQPHLNLKELSVEHYGGTRFPDWFGDNSLQNLVSLKLYNCKYCLFLPPLSVLSSLKRLSLVGFDLIVNIGDEFYGDSSSSIPFQSLEILEFENMKGWEDWKCRDILGAFPNLQKLHIRNCPRLKEHLPEQLLSLKSIHIENCKQLTASLSHATTIHELTLMKCGMLQFGNIPSVLNMGFPILHCHEFLVSIYIHSSCESLRTFPLDFFPKLQRLSFRECNNLEMISVSEGHDDYATSMTWLDIRDCPKFVSFPKGGLSAPKLDWCYIEGLEKLKSLPKKMDILLPSLRKLMLSNCPQVEFFQGGFPSSLKDLSIYNCPKLVASRTKWGWQILNSLERMVVEDENIEFPPDEELLPCSLTHLCLLRCSNLRTLDCLGHLFSLKVLSLQGCPRLECLPKEGLPSSLSSLEIIDCPLLERRCQKQNGEDWEKIAHIHYLNIR